MRQDQRPYSAGLGDTADQIDVGVRFAEVLDLLRQYFFSHMTETLSMLGEIEEEGSQGL